ncbi:MAG: hypothetical protein ACOCXQ_00070 [Patescibacteria group bacterium]
MQQNKTKLFIGLIAGSGVVLLVLIVAVMMIMNQNTSQDTADSTRRPTQPVRPTTIPAPILNEQPSSPESVLDPVEEVTKNFPVDLTSDFPRDLTVSIEDSSQEELGLISYTVDADTEDDVFQVRFEINDQTNDSEYEGISGNPDIYQVADTEMELLTTVDGVDLYVSRTGASKQTIVPEVGPVLEIEPQPEVATNKDGLGEHVYYIYQKFGEIGYSEHLTIHSDPRFENVPDYQNSIIVSYWITDDSGIENWETYKELLIEAVSAVKPSSSS